MLENGATAIMQFDGESWNETHGSIKHRIRDILGFAKHEIVLMESGGSNGITETVSFTVRGLGWFVDFTTGAVNRAPEWDAVGQPDDVED